MMLRRLAALLAAARAQETRERCLAAACGITRERLAHRHKLARAIERLGPRWVLHPVRRARAHSPSLSGARCDRAAATEPGMVAEQNPGSAPPAAHSHPSLPAGAATSSSGGA